MLTRKLFVDRTQLRNRFPYPDYLCENHAPYVIDKAIELNVFLDASSIELFVDGGKLVITDILFQILHLISWFLFKSWNCSAKKAELYELNSIW